MKAAVLARYGPPESVRVVEVDVPRPDANELLVKVRATTVNRTDCGYRAAKPFILRFLTGLFRPKRAVLGTEFAGEVEATGDDVTAFAVGDRVFGYIEGRFGAHAEFLTIPDDASVATMPRRRRSKRPPPALRVLTTRSRISGPRRSTAVPPSSSTGPPAPSDRRQCNSRRACGPT